MSDKNFDQQLNQALKDLEVPYDASSWSFLEHRLDAVFTEETPAPVDAVDKAMFHTLERMEAPYQPAHWDLLNKQLQLQQARVRRLRIAKMAEAAIFLLCITNLGLFMNHKSWRFPSSAPAARPDVPVASTNTGHRGRGAGSGNGHAAPAWLPASLARTVTSASAPDFLSDNYLNAPSVSAVLGQLQSVANSAAQPVIAGVPSSDFLPTDALASLTIPDRTALLNPVLTKPFRKSGPVYMATFASSNQNWVNVNGNQQATSGYGAGIAVGSRRAKWTVETGVSYAHNTYVPKKQIEIYDWNAKGYYGSTITAVNTEMINIPVKVSRQVARVGKATVHAVAGISANIATHKAYDYGTVFYPDPLPNSQPPQNQTPKLRQAGHGVLEGGPLNDNFFASIDAGVRFEHPIAGGRYTAFVEPMYRKSLTNRGVGPKREPVNSLVIQAGVMAFL